MSKAPARTIVHIDPFFDNDGSGQADRDPLLPAMPNGGKVGTGSTQATAFTPNPRGYTPVEQAAPTRIGGRPLTGVMRGSPLGNNLGVIIPRATSGGIPAGTNPHAINDVVMHIDTHIPGQSSDVRVGDVTSAAIAEASRQAAEETPEPYDMATSRIRGAAIMHGIAALGNSRPAQSIQPQPVNGTQAVSPPAAGRPSNPLSAFTRPAAPAGQPNFINTTTNPQATAVPTPQIRVQFEVEKLGTMESVYHDVIIGANFVLLCYKTAFVYGSKYFPPASDPQPRMAMKIDGQNEVYLVIPTGVQYSYEGTDFCLLMLTQTVAPQG